MKLAPGLCTPLPSPTPQPLPVQTGSEGIFGSGVSFGRWVKGMARMETKPQRLLIHSGEKTQRGRIALGSEGA